MRQYKRIVVKAGSSILTAENEMLNTNIIDSLIRQVVKLNNSNREVLLVSSGAISTGMKKLGYKTKPDTLFEQQAAAAIGQCFLMETYNKYLSKYGSDGAQILLTAGDFENRNRFLNTYNTLTTLLKQDIIPVINENDTVATDEIKFGDNDTLAAKVAGLIEADLIINLTDIEGLYSKKPDENTDTSFIIREVKNITDELEKVAGGKGKKHTTGGMITKIEGAKIAVNSGITMVIGSGYKENIILRIIDMLENKEDYNLGTTFLPAGETLNKRKQWLNYNIQPAGKLYIDSGAKKALIFRGKSLLPSGITGIKENFKRGDLVEILSTGDQIIGRGIVNYTSDEISKIKGKHTGYIPLLLGYVNEEEVIHRDNMVIKRGVKNDY